MTTSTHQGAARQAGFTLVELMIAMTLGLLILAGMVTLFLNNTQAQGEIEKANRQIENGRFALEQLAGDLRNAGYYAEFDPTVLASPATLPDPCTLAVTALVAALPLPVQGSDNAVVSCLPDQRADTDVVVVRHAATCVAGVGGCDPVTAGGPLFQASLCDNLSELGSGNSADFYALDLDTLGMTRHRRDCTSAAGSGTLAAIRRFETHIYFVANNDKPGDGVPTLKRADVEVSNGALALNIVPLAEGIENLQAEYGVDTDANGVPDQFASDPGGVAGCAAADCAVTNWRHVVAVKLNLLARNTEVTAGYTDAKSYQLGHNANGGVNTVGPFQDHYKRHVFQALVGLPNPAGRMTP